MGLEYDESYYNEVLLLTSLKKDIDLFKFGDLTVVGDRGITLSGGQKARLSLARAVYTKRDIVLLDDPLSAVDAEVSANIFQNCIRNHLNDKTVVLATHQIHVISEADKILVIDNGRQLFFGNYEELQKRDDVFHIVGKLMNQDTEEQIPQKRPKVNENNKTVEEKDKLTIQEEERAEGSVPFSVYHRFLVYGVGTCLLIPLLFLLLLAVQANYIAIV